MTKNLISVVSLIVISTILSTFIHCQNTSIFEDYLEGSVPDVRAEDSAPQKFLMTTDYLDYDLYGNFKRKNRVSGEITILEDGNKKWNDIKTYHAQNLNESYPEGERRIYMEDGYLYEKPDLGYDGVRNFCMV